MSPWPGAPKSQQSPALNQPSTRYAPKLDENSTMGDVARAVNKAFDGLTVHEQAFANLPAQIKAQAASAASSSSASSASSSSSSSSAGGPVSAFNSRSGSVVFFPSLGMVNDQLGNPAYLTQNSDSGAKIIVGTDSTVSVVLNSKVPAPWFTIIDNDSSGICYLSTDSGSVFGAQFIPDSGFGIVFFDGSNFWAGATLAAGGGSSGVTQIIAGTNVTISPAGGTGAVTVSSSGGYSLGGSVAPSNVAFGPAAGSGAAVVLCDGLDGTHEVKFTTGSAPTSTGVIFTFTFTNPRGHSTFPVIAFQQGFAVAIFPWVSGGSGLSYTVNANGTALSAGTTYWISVSAP